MIINKLKKYIKKIKIINKLIVKWKKYKKKNYFIKNYIFITGKEIENNFICAISQ
jgi:hypothetical protein